MGAALILAGLCLLAWGAWRALERRAAERQGRAALAAEAAALAAIEPAARPAPAPQRRPAPGSVLARIVAPAVGVDVVAREGVDARTLERGAGHFPSTAPPGGPGNSAFAAHRDVEFRGLRKIGPGHDVYVETPEATFVYRVVETRVVEPDEVGILADRGASELTLVTCHPFDWVGPAPRRYVVRAELEGRFDPEDRILADLPAAGAGGR